MHSIFGPYSVYVYYVGACNRFYSCNTFVVVLN